MLSNTQYQDLSQHVDALPKEPKLIDQLGLIAVVIMVGSYALEAKHAAFILIFAFGCALAATYAWLIGSTPFLIAEGVWTLLALKRWLGVRSKGAA